MLNVSLPSTGKQSGLVCIGVNVKDTLNEAHGLFGRGWAAAEGDFLSHEETSRTKFSPETQC